MLGTPSRCVQSGRFNSSLTPLERFAAKCRFDPYTGCVVWIGGKTSGRGNSAVYGSFRDGTRRWAAHRWSAVHIHGFDLTGLTAGHCCPHTLDGHPNTLCVEHVKPETLGDNVAERNTRVADANRAKQSALQRQFWLFVDRGFEPAPARSVAQPGPDDFPFHTPPAWFAPFMPKPSRVSDTLREHGMIPERKCRGCERRISECACENYCPF